MTTTLTTNPLNHMITEIKSKTLQAVHLLRQVNFSEAQAEVIADLIEQNSENAAQSIAQIVEQKVEQKIKISEEKQVKDLESVATKGDLAEVKSVLKTDIAKLKSDLELKIEKLRSDTKIEIEKVRAEIEKSKSETIRWVVGMAAAQIGVLLATLIKILH